MKKSLLLALAALPLPALPALAQAEHGAPAGPLTVEGGLMVWTVFVFLLLLLILRKFAWPAVLGAVEARERARREIREERERAVADLRREAVDLALAAAGKLIGERLESDTDRRLVMSYLTTLEPQP